MSQEVFRKVKQYLDQQGVTYREVEHAPGASAEDYHNALGCRYEQQAKCLLLKVTQDSEKSFIIFVLPAQKRADLEQVRTIIAADSVKMAGRDDLKTVTGCDFGELPPLANAFGLKLLMDKDFLTEEEIYMNAGKVDASFIMSPHDLVKIENPQLV